MQTQRILIFTSIFPPDIGGPATFVNEFSKRLIHFGGKVQILTFSNIKTFHFQTFVKERVTIHKIPFRNHIILRSLYALYFLITHKNEYTLIYAHGSVWDTGLPALIATKTLRKKLVIKVTGDNAWERSFQKKNFNLSLEEFYVSKTPLKIKIFKFLQRFISNHCDKIIVPSTYCKTLVEKLNPSNSKKIAIIYNAVSLDNPPYSKDKIREILELNPKSFILLSITRLVLHKGIQEMIEIMDKLITKIPQAELLIIGSGPVKIPPRPHVKHMEAIENSKCHLFYKASDIFILNSKYEGLSHVILEAMSHGLPCVVSNVGGNAEVILSGKNGFLFKHNDYDDCINKITTLYNNSDLYKNTSKLALERAKNFSWQHCLARHRNIFSELSP